MTKCRVFCAQYCSINDINKTQIFLLVDPNTRWLREPISSKVYMPDVHGGFNLPHSELSYGSILHVEGNNCVTSVSNSAGRRNGSGNTLTSVGGPSCHLSSTFQSIIPKRSNLSATRYSLKVYSQSYNEQGRKWKGNI